jgi:glucosylceramidase
MKNLRSSGVQLVEMIFFLTLISLSASAQTKVNWISTSQTEKWKKQKDLVPVPATEVGNVEIRLDNPMQTIDGFGACFNELGWTSLSYLTPDERAEIFQELFQPDKGANFTICRMPVGANDFSRNWYSYDETDGDFAMKNFSIANDFETLIPFIKSALKYNPGLKLWASPWSPPTWMKNNKHYASQPFPKGAVPKEVKEKWGMDFEGFDNGLKPGQEGVEGTDMFVQDKKYFEAYSLYFSKFIQAYRQQNINISMVMPQNEFNSAQVFPSCTWTSKGLSNFLQYLVPQMNSLNVDVFIGTMERPDYRLVDSILADNAINKSIKGVGFQWAGKDAIGAIHAKYPKLTLYQSEQECGNGKNDWSYCIYTWDLMKHYFTKGANAYMYWNTSLIEGGISTWGWRQNSLISVDSLTKTYKYNYEFYLMKHLSHFVKPGAKRLETKGDFNNLLAFINADQSIVVVVRNDSQEVRTLNIKIGDKAITPVLEADSFNTFVVQ